MLTMLTNNVVNLEQLGPGVRFMLLNSTIYFGPTLTQWSIQGI